MSDAPYRLADSARHRSSNRSAYGPAANCRLRIAACGEPGVAAPNLVAVALMNPLRRRVQRVVDRRFNRSRYNAEATVAAFPHGFVTMPIST
jgi:hypothetical protein